MLRSVCVCVCADVGVHLRKGGMCAAGLLLLLLSPIWWGPPDGNRSKVTELWLDKHRSPASISYPVRFGNTWLFFLAAAGQREEAGGGGGGGEKEGARGWGGGGGLGDECHKRDILMSVRGKR